jgi:hypothetical protein
VRSPSFWLVATLLLAGIACQPATLGDKGTGGAGGAPGPPRPEPPPELPLKSCGDGKIDAAGSTAAGPFVATAINVRANACGSASAVLFEIAGNNAPTSALVFSLPAEYLEGYGVRLPLGEQLGWGTISGQRAMVTVTITAFDDAFLPVDGGAGPRVEGSFEEYDGGTTIKGIFSCPICSVWPCITVP